MRLDRWLRGRLVGVPQGRIARLLRTGQIRVNGSRARVDRRLVSGEQVRMPPFALGRSDVPPARPPVAPGDIEWFDRAVLYRDESVLAIDKPSGLAVQGGTGQRRCVDDIASAWMGERARTAPRLVHRIDRETSGVLLLALNRSAAVALARSFRERRVQKIYWAAVETAPKPRMGSLSTPLALEERAGERRMRVASRADPGARDALTEYVTLAVAEQGDCAWLALRPRTGRMHQLRSHLAAAGCPILGDTRYGAARGHRGVRRLCLHAHTLAFPHPVHGATVVVSAAMDEDLRNLWQEMGWKEAEVPVDPFPTP